MIRYAIELVRRLLKSERGQDVVEYAMLTGGIGIALAIILLATPFTTYMTQFATAIGNCINLIGTGYTCP